MLLECYRNVLLTFFMVLTLYHHVHTDCFIPQFMHLPFGDFKCIVCLPFGSNHIGSYDNDMNRQYRTFVWSAIISTYIQYIYEQVSVKKKHISLCFGLPVPRLSVYF